MNIVSIDNMTDAAGYDNLTSFLVELNAEPVGPLKRVLIAMLPEYDDAGVLKRIDCITVPTEDPGSLSGGLDMLMEGAAQITAGQKLAYAIAEAKEDHAITVVDDIEQKVDTMAADPTMPPVVDAVRPVAKP